MTRVITTADLLAALPSLDDAQWLLPFEDRARFALSHGDEGVVDARRARAAAQVARFVARSTSDTRALPGVRWQLEQARHLVADLRADDTEAAHLSGVLQAAALAAGRSGMLPLALLAYGHHLARATRWEEALIFTALAVRAADPMLSSRDAAAAALLAGRARAALREWEAAAVAYAIAERAAFAGGDAMSAARATLGLAECARGRGDLPTAEARSTRLLTSARGAALADVRAEALLLLGDVMSAQGRHAEALDATYRALAHTEGDAQMLAGLAALAHRLTACGAGLAARSAWRLVRDGDAGAGRIDALLALLDLESQTGDRLAFERCRREMQQALPLLAPARRTDALVRMGVGSARFGRRAAAVSALEAALVTARAAELVQWQGTIARLLETLPLAGADRSLDSDAALPPLVARVAHGLAAIVAARSA